MLFEMLQSGVKDFLDAMKLGTPGFFHVVEAPIHISVILRGSPVHVIKARVHMRSQFAETSVHVIQTRITDQDTD